MVAFPAVTPVTRPVEALMVATPDALLVQVPPEIVEVKVVVSERQTVWVPLRVPAVGAADTVRLRVAVALAQPLVPETV